MIDLTQYGDQELSLHVLNDEWLYRGFLRCEDYLDLQRLVDGTFIYTRAQFEELLADLSED